MVNERGVNYRVVVEVGNEHFPPGRTRVEANSDGQVQAITRLEGEEFQTEGRFDPSEIDRAAADIATNLVDQVDDRQGLPDEPRYHLTVYLDAERVRDITVWRSSLPNHHSVKHLIEVLNRVAQEISDGETTL